MNLNSKSSNGKIYITKIKDIRVTHNGKDISIDLTKIKSFKEIEDRILSIIFESKEIQSVNEELALNEESTIDNETDDYFNNINAVGKSFNNRIDQKTSKIAETEKALREAKLFLTTKILIPDGNTTNSGRRFLAWRSIDKHKPYRIVFIGSIMDDDDKPAFIIKPFIETPLKIRLKYVEYLSLLIDEVLRKAQKTLRNID